MANSAAEESARSAYAWTIFDVSLLSMCSKPNNASVADLLSKLNNLDMELPSAEKKTLHQLRTPSKEPKEPGWNDVLKAVYAKDKDMGEILHKLKYLGLEDGKNFVVDCSDCPETISGIAQKAVSTIQEILYELYGGIYKIDIRNSVVMQRVESKMKRKQLLLEKEIVQSTVEIMGAKVKDVKIY
jgi:hypothetical protein